MMGVLFLIVWTGIFALAAYFSWEKMVKHLKVYVMMIYNCVYLSGVFMVYPQLG